MRRLPVVRLLVLTSIGLLTLHCGKPREQPTSSQNREARFKLARCIDREGIGIEAFSVLIPADWTFSADIRWNLENPGMPAVGSMTTGSPDGSRQVNAFPNQSFFWTDNPMTLSLFPVGSRYFGAEVRPVMSVHEMLRRVALPRFRGRAKGLVIVMHEDVPELARLAASAAGDTRGVGFRTEGGRIRVEYSSGNRRVEEDLYGVVEQYRIPLQTLSGVSTSTLWTADYLFSLKADKGRLDSSAQLFRVILGSFRVNPQWYNRYTQVVAALISANIRRIHQIGELSRMISRTSDQISDDMLRSYNERQAVYDRLADNFSRHIRDVDAYYDPYQERQVELPAGYVQAWTNNLGEYVVSESEDFNPNIGSNLHWERMERK
jgi:hypothetical protein